MQVQSWELGVIFNLPRVQRANLSTHRWIQPGSSHLTIFHHLISFRAKLVHQVIGFQISSRKTQKQSSKCVQESDSLEYQAYQSTFEFHLCLGTSYHVSLSNHYTRPQLYHKVHLLKDWLASWAFLILQEGENSAFCTVGCSFFVNCSNLKKMDCWT